MSILDFYKTIHMDCFHIQLKTNQNANYSSCNVVFTYAQSTHNETECLRWIYSHLNTGSLYRSKHEQRYVITKWDIVEKLINFCIQNDSSDLLAVSYKSILKRYKNFKEFNPPERIALFAEVDRFNYRWKGLKKLSNGKSRLTALKVCEEWLRHKPLEKEIREDLKRLSFHLRLQPMYKF